MLGLRRRVASRLRPAETPYELSGLAEALLSPIRDGHVDSDPVQPGLGRGGRPPPAPAAECPLVRLLGAVFRGRQVAHQRDEGAQDPPVAVAVQPFEVGLRAWSVLLGRRPRRRGAVRGGPVY